MLGASTLATFGASGGAQSDPLDPIMKSTKERVQGIGGLFCPRFCAIGG